MPEPVELSLRSIALAALAERFTREGFLRREAPEVVYLRSHLAAVEARGQDWAGGLEEYLKAPDRQDALLLDLAPRLGLSYIELLAIALAAAVDDDPMVGRAVAQLQAPLGGSRPTLGLLGQALSLGPAASDLPPIQQLATGPAVQSGLLELVNPEAPLPECSILVPAHLGLALGGWDGSLPGTTLGLGAYPAVPLPPSTEAEVQRQARALRTPDAGALVVRTGSPAEGRTVAQALAQALGRRPLFIEAEPPGGLVPWLLLRDLLPVFVFELAPGERRALPPLPWYGGPVLAVGGPEGSVDVAGGSIPSWSLQVPSVEERKALWKLAVGDTGIAVRLATDYRHSSGRIAHLGRLARQHGRLEERDRPNRADVAAVAWVAEGGGLEAFAQPLLDPIPKSALVTTPQLEADLEALVARCRLRDRLAQGLGVSVASSYHPGVRTLFVGPSGTGKTLAAGWLATRLGMPLFRVDLASVTSKYIGETEKNLAELLARAEQAEVVLLFDEADSLFGKRTDVKEANDRFANAQTNYLLQRIETYDGIVLLTSNNRSRFDPSFARRLDMIIEFPIPGPEQRRDLWLSHLGRGHRLREAQINLLAIAANLTGGGIRSAVLSAAVLAGRARRKIRFEDVQAGVRDEYRKLGQQVPGELESA